MELRKAGVILASLVAHSLGPYAAAQVPAGGEFPVNTFTTDHQHSPSVAFGPAGDFVVAWESFPECPPPPGSCVGTGQDGDRGGVFLRRFDRTGAAMGGDLQVNVATTNTQWRPAIARLADRRFVVVWETMGDPAGRFLGRLLEPSGIPVGGEFSITQDFSGAYPDVAAQGDGFVVAWKPPNAGPVSARRFSNHGVPLAPAFVVGGSTAISGPTRVGADADGNFVVVWSDADGDGSGVFARRFDAGGSPSGPAFQVNVFTPGFQTQPDVTMSATGHFAVAWRSLGQGAVYARRFGADGAPLGPELQVSAVTTFPLWPSLAMADDGSVLVTWPDDRGPSGLATSIKGRWYDRAGVARPEVRIDSAPAWEKLSPVVEQDSVGNAVVAWTSLGQDGSQSGVFAQRFGGLLPVGMAVDTLAGPTSDGNGVFEPNETVSVEPGWRNVSGAVMLPFTGTAGAFTGPAGSFYMLFDGAATYPLVLANEVARCRAESDCYLMGVGDPDGRPSVHWDSVFREDILPNAPFLSKSWSLHLGDSFADVARTSGFYRFVETILHNGVTAGCAAADYCPAASTSREQMAVFALVAKEGAGYAPAACGVTSMFADVPPTSPFCRWIEELARRGVIAGCGGGNYCPLSAVTREEMAIFALKTLEGAAYVPPPCGVPVYTDVPAASAFCPYIEELTRRGVVSGCGNGAYCPSLAVSREQMSVFLTVTFGLQLYGP